MKRIILLFTALLSLSGTVAVLYSPVAAADARSFCSERFERSGDPAYAACVAGYNRGDEQNPICEREFTRPVERNGIVRSKDDLVSACRDGWNQYTRDRAACDGQQNAEACRSQLRSGTTPGAIAKPPEGGDESDNKPPIGPAPNSGNIADYENPDGAAEYHKCGIESFFGTLLCGATATMGRITDAAFHFLEIFLKAPPLVEQTEDGETSAVFTAWSYFRNLANILFVIAFLIIVYSHITSAGISNYNVKKIVPRIIISALLVNLSFYVCMLLVDLSNILGGTLVGTLGSLVPPAPVGQTDLSTWEKVTGSTLLLGGSAIALGAAALYLNISVLVPVLVSALIAAAVTLLVLILRQALIIVFVIIAPLAFAAILLPGTKSWFDRWRGAFIPLLMLYPVVALIYGGSQIAAVTVQRVGAANGETLVAIFSLGIQLVPLLATPFIMKLGGGVINRFAGTAENAGIAKGARKKAEDFAKLKSEQRDARALSRPPSKWNKLRNARDRGIQRRYERDKKAELTKENLGTAQTLHVVGYVENEDEPGLLEKGKEKASGMVGGNYQAKAKNDKYLEGLAQSSDPDAKKRAQARVIQAKVKGHIGSVKAMSAEFELRGTTRNDLLDMATGENANATALEREAAIMRLASAGDMGAIITMLKSSKSMTTEQRQMLVQSAQKHAGGAPFLGNQQVQDNIVQNGVGLASGESYTPSDAERAGLSEQQLQQLIDQRNQEAIDADFAEQVIAPSVGAAAGGGSHDEYSAQGMVDIDKDAVAEIEKAVNNDQHAGLFDQNNVGDLKRAAYDALSYDHTNSRVGKQRDELSLLARDHLHGEALAENDARRQQAIDQAHEEAHVQNALFDMERRGRNDS